MVNELSNTLNSIASVVDKCGWTSELFSSLCFVYISKSCECIINYSINYFLQWIYLNSRYVCWYIKFVKYFQNGCTNYSVTFLYVQYFVINIFKYDVSYYIWTPFYIGGIFRLFDNTLRVISTSIVVIQTLGQFVGKDGRELLSYISWSFNTYLYTFPSNILVVYTCIMRIFISFN